MPHLPDDHGWLLGCGPRLAQLSLSTVQRLFADEARAAELLTVARWPLGLRCPLCGSSSAHDCRENRRLPLYKCPACNYQFTVTSGTVLHGTRVALGTWLRVLYLLETNPSALRVRRLARESGLSHKTAWMLLRRIEVAGAGAIG